MSPPGSHLYSYYPGCSLQTTNRSYDVSARNVAQTLGIDLVELDDWNCCGATAYMAIHEKRSFVLSARNLALAEKQGGDLVTLCSGCYVVLHKTAKYVRENEELREEVDRALAAGGMSYAGTVNVRHFLDVVVRDLGESLVRRAVVTPLQGLRVAPYYGCQIGRPFGEIDDEEDPQLLDTLLRWLGAEPVPFPMKAKCCGGMLMTTMPETGRRLAGERLLNARNNGADCIVTACPLCQVNLEAYQQRIGKTMHADCRIPVLYFTQLMGVALGLSPADLLFKDSFTPVESMLAEKVATV